MVVVCYKVRGLYLEYFNWQRRVYELPTVEQPGAMSAILTEALNKYIHTSTKSYLARPDDQPWTNTHTRRLLRKKNRNYKIFERANNSYKSAVSDPNSTEEVVTTTLRFSE